MDQVFAQTFDRLNTERKLNAELVIKDKGAPATEGRKVLIGRDWSAQPDVAAFTATRSLALVATRKRDFSIGALICGIVAGMAAVVLVWSLLPNTPFYGNPIVPIIAAVVLLLGAAGLIYLDRSAEYANNLAADRQAHAWGARLTAKGIEVVAAQRKVQGKEPGKRGLLQTEPHPALIQRTPAPAGTEGDAAAPTAQSVGSAPMWSAPTGTGGLGGARTVDTPPEDETSILKPTAEAEATQHLPKVAAERAAAEETTYLQRVDPEPEPAEADAEGDAAASAEPESDTVEGAEPEGDAAASAELEDDTESTRTWAVSRGSTPAPQEDADGTAGAEGATDTDPASQVTPIAHHDDGPDPMLDTAGRRALPPLPDPEVTESVAPTHALPPLDEDPDAEAQQSGTEPAAPGEGSESQDQQGQQPVGFTPQAPPDSWLFRAADDSSPRHAAAPSEPISGRSPFARPADE